MRRISKFKNILWYSGVGLLLLLAVATTLFRLLFTSVEDYRQQLETVAGQYLGLPVSISGIEARVAGIKPSVVLKEVALLQPDNRAPLSRFASVAIALDPIASLRTGTPVVELTVSGANLIITRRADGSIGLQGLALPTQRETVASQGSALGNWLLSQKRLALTDSRIVLADAVQNSLFSFDNVELELRNDDERHRLNGTVNLPRAIGKELRVAIDIHGNLLAQKDWWGTLYVKSAQLQAAPWLEHIRWRETALRDGVLDMELWSHWRGGFLESLLGSVDARHLQLQQGARLQHIERVAGEVRLSLQEGGWDFDGQHLLLQRGVGETAVPMRLQLARGAEGERLRLDRLQLEDAAALAMLVPQLGEETRRWLQHAAPRGSVHDLSLQRGEGGRLRLQGRLTGFQLKPYGKIPGVSAISAALRFDGDDGELLLSGNDSELELPQLFRRPLSWQRLDGRLRLHRDGQGWRIHSEGFELANRDLSAVVGGEVLLPVEGRPWLGLQLALREGNVQAIRHYLPAGKLSEKTLYWLDHAFVAGRIPAATMVFHGHPADFPFRAGEGHFEVQVAAQKLQLHYRDGWPDLHDIAGGVRFVGTEMVVDARSGRVFDAALGPTVVSIADLRQPQLLVQGRAVASAGDGLRFLRESPLGKNGGGVLEGMSAQGKVDLRLDLAIPLRPEIAKRQPLQVNGEVAFNSCRLKVAEGVTLQGLSGDLLFTEKSFDAFDLRADLYGAPASIAVITEEGEQPDTLIVARGGADAESLRRELALPILDYLQGESEWQASLRLPRRAGASSQLQILSTLRGMALTLPAPAAKTADEERGLDLTLYLGGPRRGEYRLGLGEDSGIAWLRDPKRPGVRRAMVVLGERQPLALPERESIEVRGRAEGVSVAAWREVFRKLRGESAAADDRPVPIDIRMTQLHLLAGEGGGAPQAPLRPAEVPPLTVEVGDFSYDNMHLGEVSLRLTPDGKGMRLDPISARSPAFTLSGRGSWDEQGGTRLTLHSDAQRLDQMMEALGFASVITKGKSAADATVQWPGSPVDFSLATLEGDLHLAIEAGRIEEVEPGAGRLLGILSISALPRRLFLDFSDLLQKGLDFSSIEGDVRLEKGQAYTSNLHLESLSANVLMTGRTGLLARDFDQQVIVVPNVSESVSVAGALAWGPQVAAILLVLQKVFQSDIDAATMIRYKLSGSWNDPVIERLDEVQGPLLLD